MVHKRNGWIGIELTNDIIEQAKEIRAKRDSQYGNIFDENETDLRLIGDVGEIVFNIWLKHHKVSPLEWIYENAAGKVDFIAFSSTIDVKTVKRSVDMQPNYTAQVTARHTKKDVDYYFFCVYETHTGIFWLLGGITKVEFLKKAIYYGEGMEVHPKYKIRKGHEIYNIAVSDLTLPDDWLASLSVPEDI